MSLLKNTEEQEEHILQRFEISFLILFIILSPHDLFLLLLLTALFFLLFCYVIKTEFEVKCPDEYITSIWGTCRNDHHRYKSTGGRTFEQVFVCVVSLVSFFSCSVFFSKIILIFYLLCFHPDGLGYKHVDHIYQKTEVFVGSVY